MTTYFISDIHLHESSELQSELLLNFLRTHGPTADAIYILGDLFALWLGDDLNELYSLPLIAALQALTDKGVPLYFMHGNRDFLVSSKFCNITGCKLLSDPCVIDLYGSPALLTHGDLMCTADTSYQRFRRVVQNRFIKALFLKLPIAIRKKLAFWIKARANNKIAKPAELYDVVPESAAQWFSKYNVQLIIHGHTHKSAIHNHASKTRIVLGDWNDSSAKILSCNSNGYELIDLLAAPSRISLKTSAVTAS
jgi:UDP-2,3-diacylglucosamine hydrolase